MRSPRRAALVFVCLVAACAPAAHEKPGAAHPASPDAREAAAIRLDELGVPPAASGEAEDPHAAHRHGAAAPSASAPPSAPGSHAGHQHPP